MRACICFIFALTILDCEARRGGKMRGSHNFLQCRFCQSKYKTQEKLQRHIQETHADAVVDTNSAALTTEQKLALLQHLDAYVHLLLREDIRLNNEAEVDTAIHTFLHAV